MHACQLETVEDILANPSSVPFNTEIDSALTPFITVLKALLLNPEKIDNAYCPAKNYLLQNGLSLTKTLISDVGDINFIDRARVSNWFQVHIGAEENIEPHVWMGRLPIAHAFTILLASRLRYKIVLDPIFPTSDMQEKQDQFIMESAWEYQRKKVTGGAWIETDVDSQCLENLEIKMFERSARVGVSGHWQWGLDAGTHQEGWDPYHNLPTHWYHDDREGSESELQVCCNLIALPITLELELIDAAWPEVQ